MECEVFLFRPFAPKEEGMEPKAYTVAEFLEVYKLSRSTFYRLLKSGEAPAVMRVRRKLLVSVDDAESWAKARVQHRTLPA